MSEPTPTDAGSETRTVTSADGTEIAVERTGSGPPIVLVHGAVSDRRSWDVFGLREPLADRFAVYAMDRRGHGESGDDDPYEIERVFEDVAAVVDSIGEPVTLLGLSSGALYALEGARRTDGVARLVLYEPPIGFAESPGMDEGVAELTALLEEGEDEDALLLFLRDLVGLLPEEIELLRSDPYWDEQVTLIHTLPLEMGAATAYEFDPAPFETMDTPTLLVTGSESHQVFAEATRLLEETLPNSRVEVLDGRGHIGLATAQEQFLDEVLAFVGDPV